MKNLTKTLAVSFLALSISLTSCDTSTEDSILPESPVANTTNTQTTNNSTTQTTATLSSDEFKIVERFIKAINDNNREAGLALITTNAGYAYSLTGSLNTGVAFRNWLESDLFGPRAVINIERASQDRNVVRIQGRWGRNGNATNSADYYFTVENGLITAWRLV
jgi:hypothetical protein